MVTEMLDELKTSGTVARGWLGVGVQSVDEVLATALELDEPRGAMIGEVHEDTPAESGGLQSNDVVLSVDGKRISDHESLVRTIGRKAPGEVVKLSIRRGSKTLKLSIKLGERPNEATLQSRYQPRPSPR